MKHLKVKAIIIGAVTKYALDGFIGAVIAGFGYFLHSGINLQSMMIDATSSIIAGFIVGRMINGKVVLNAFSTWLFLFFITGVIFLILHFGFNNRAGFNVAYYLLVIDMIFILIGTFVGYSFKQNGLKLVRK